MDGASDETPVNPDYKHCTVLILTVSGPPLLPGTQSLHHRAWSQLYAHPISIAFAQESFELFSLMLKPHLPWTKSVIRGEAEVCKQNPNVVFKWPWALDMKAEWLLLNIYQSWCPYCTQAPGDLRDWRKLCPHHRTAVDILNNGTRVEEQRRYVSMAYLFLHSSFSH